MILLHHIDGNEFWVSARIKMIEPGADTVVHLMSGDIFRVTEAAEEIVEKVRDWEQSIHSTVKVRKVETVTQPEPHEAAEPPSA